MEPIATRESVYGFIATEPTLKPTQNGGMRFYARFGQVPSIPVEGGGFEEGEAHFHNLAVYDRMAEIAFERFRKGDRFIAQGEIHTYTRPVEGQEVPDEEFRAARISHDSAMTDYTVSRGRSAGRESGRESGRSGPTPDGVEAEPSGPDRARTPQSVGSHATESGRTLADISAGQGAPAARGNDIPF
jgi:single-strand DNA-binding protein